MLVQYSLVEVCAVAVAVLLQNPPNFLRQAELSSHVKPMAVVPEPEPEPEVADDDSSEMVIDTLVDTSTPPVWLVNLFFSSLVNCSCWASVFLD